MSGILSVSAFVTLDGVMQAPGGPDEDRDGGFEHGGWSVPYFTDDLGEIVTDQFARVDAFLLGRRTYEIFAAHWPHVTDDGDPVATKLNAAPKHVVSRTLDTLAWHNAHLLRGDVGQAVADLKARTDGEINVQGSVNLLATLQRHDLVDRYQLIVEPVVLGTGKRLFAPGTPPAALRLTHARQVSSGALYCVYERAGRPTYGAFDLDTYEADRRRRTGTDA